MTARTDRRDLTNRLTRVGDGWQVIALGASRWYRLKAQGRHPGYEFVHERNGDWWTVYARSKPPVWRTLRARAVTESQALREAEA
mgnify:CR=1 FL=1